MKNFLIGIIITLLILPIVILVTDFVYFNLHRCSNKNLYAGQKFHYIVSNPHVHKLDISNFFNGKSNVGGNGRLPDGLQYKSKPIIIFGDSYAFGQYLDRTQTLSYKLAEILKRPVYNRAICGGGLQHMYYQTENVDFYKNVPVSDLVIYVIISDHYRRMLGESFDIFDNYLYLHYKVKNKGLVIDNYNNYLLNICKSSYTLRLIRHKLKNYYINNPNNAEKLTDDAILYFTNSRKNLENHWNKKIKFYVLIYQDIPYKELLIKKLKKNGFITIDTAELTKHNLSAKSFKMQKHPTEKAWNELVPKLVLKLKNQE